MINGDAEKNKYNSDTLTFFLQILAYVISGTFTIIITD